MSRVLLIAPTYYSDYEQTDVYFPMPPISLAYIGACLLKAGHEAKILDVLGRMALVKKTIEEFKPDIVGIQCYTTGYSEFKRTVSEIKTYYNGLIVAGGPHITAIGENDLPVDYFVSGEGEEVMVKLANGWRPEKRLIEAEIIKDLDALPFPAWHLIEMQLYKNEPRMSFIGSRGCPYKCIFCFDCHRWTGTRFRDPEKIVEEIEEFYRTYKNKKIYFMDDTFVLNPGRIKRLADLLEGKGFELSINGRCNLMTDELCKDLKRMGVKDVYLGVESGNQRLLDLINKNQTVEQIINSLELCKKYGFHVTAFMLMNLPTQTREEIKSDLEFSKMIIRKHKVIVDYSILYCYPNTPVFKMLGREIKDWSAEQHKWRYPNVPIWEEPGKSKEEMIELYRKICMEINWVQTSIMKKPTAIVKYILRNAYRKTAILLNPDKKFGSR
ncbi:MAG: radical SAM protein [Candidatus Aenigmatarchaeota archaeon]